MSIFDLSGKTVLVTGASGGIGLALVKGFADAHANVVAADLNPAAVDVAMAGNDSVLPIFLDVTDPAGIQAALSRAREKFGPIDVLVNNAGIKSAERLMDGDWEKIKRTLAINADAVLNLPDLSMLTL